MSQIEPEQPQKESRPIWGTLSLALAFFAIVLCVLLVRLPEVMPINGLVLLPIMLFCLLGIILLLILSISFSIIGMCDRRSRTRSYPKILARLGCFFALLPVLLCAAFVAIMILVHVYEVDVFGALEKLGI